MTTSVTLEAVTLEEVERLAGLLPLQDQLRLMARVSERLSSSVTTETMSAHTPLQERLQLAEQLLAEANGTGDDAEGATDSVEVLHQLRERRRT